MYWVENSLVRVKEGENFILLVVRHLSYNWISRPRLIISLSNLFLLVDDWVLVKVEGIHAILLLPVGVRISSCGDFYNNLALGSLACKLLVSL